MDRRRFPSAIKIILENVTKFFDLNRFLGTHITNIGKIDWFFGLVFAELYVYSSIYRHVRFILSLLERVGSPKKCIQLEEPQSLKFLDYTILNFG